MDTLGAAFFHYLCVVTGFQQAHTQTTDLERATLGRYAASASSAAEIGVFEGVTTKVIAEAMHSSGILYGIDPFFPGRLGICYGKLIAERVLARANLVGRVRWVERLSFDAASLVPDELDFVFIDGDHTYEGFRRDWADWSRKVRPGGVLALHDTQPTKLSSTAACGACRYFQEIARHDERFYIVETVDSLNVLIRK